MIVVHCTDLHFLIRHYGDDTSPQPTPLSTAVLKMPFTACSFPKPSALPASPILCLYHPAAAFSSLIWETSYSRGLPSPQRPYPRRCSSLSIPRPSGNNTNAVDSQRTSATVSADRDSPSTQRSYDVRSSKRARASDLTTPSSISSTICKPKTHNYVSSACRTSPRPTMLTPAQAQQWRASPSSACSPPQTQACANPTSVSSNMCSRK